MLKEVYYATCLVPKEIMGGTPIYLGPVEPFCDECWKEMTNPDSENFYFPTYYEDVIAVTFDQPPECHGCGVKILKTILVQEDDHGNLKPCSLDFTVS